MGKNYKACLEFQLHGLEGGASLDGPEVAFLGHLHDRGGDGGRLPQQEVHVKGLQEFVVLLGGGALILADKGIHGDFS